MTYPSTVCKQKIYVVTPARALQNSVVSTSPTNNNFLKPMKIMRRIKSYLMTASALLLTGCYDEKMDWHFTPREHTAVVAGDIPLALARRTDR